MGTATWMLRHGELDEDRSRWVGKWAFGYPSCPRFADAWYQERGMEGVFAILEEPEDGQVSA